MTPGMYCHDTFISLSYGNKRNKNSNVNVIGKLKDVSGNVTTDPTVIADTFNELFANLGKNITQKNTSDYEISHGLSWKLQ